MPPSAAGAMRAPARRRSSACAMSAGARTRRPPRAAPVPPILAAGATRSSGPTRSAACDEAARSRWTSAPTQVQRCAKARPHSRRLIPKVAPVRRGRARKAAARAGPARSAARGPARAYAAADAFRRSWVPCRRGRPPGAPRIRAGAPRGGARGPPSPGVALLGAGGPGAPRARLRRLHAAVVAVVVAREAYCAVALDDRDAAAALCLRHPHRVLHRAPLGGKVRDRGAVRPALVDAPDAVLAEQYRKDRRRVVRHGRYSLLLLLGLHGELVLHRAHAADAARHLLRTASAAWA